LGIAQKECDESLYWLEILKETEIIIILNMIQIYPEVERILKLLRSIILKTKSNTEKQKLTTKNILSIINNP